MNRSEIEREIRFVLIYIGVLHFLYVTLHLRLHLLETILVRLVLYKISLFYALELIERMEDESRRVDTASFTGIQ